MMCSSGIATIVAVSLQTIGLLALLIGFFSGLGNPGARMVGAPECSWSVSLRWPSEAEFRPSVR